jgi:hypothetical protein
MERQGGGGENGESEIEGLKGLAGEPEKERLKRRGARDGVAVERRLFSAHLFTGTEIYAVIIHCSPTSPHAAEIKISQ